MSQNLLSQLFSDLWSGLSDPRLLRQVLVLGLCLAAGWVLAGMVRKRIAIDDVRYKLVRAGVEGFGKVLMPGLGFLLLATVTPILERWQSVHLLRVALPLVGSFALVRLAFYVLRRAFARGGKVGNLVLLFEKVFATLIWGGVALYITGLWPEVISHLEQIILPVGRKKASLLDIVQAVASVRVVLARMSRAVLILVAVLLSLSLVGIDLTVLSVFGGALGVGIGLGMQKIVSNYVSGFVILIERSLSIGDTVIVDKFSGQVTQINTRYTVIRGGDGVETVVPNEMLISAPVQNYSLTDRSVRLATRLVVGYQTDIESMLGMLQETVSGIPRVAAEPPPLAALTRFEADGFEVELGFWINDPENGRLNVLSEVNLAVWKTLQLQQVEIPYPQREVRVFEMTKDQAGGGRTKIPASDAGQSA
jgi:small-conductance mechanosensitive channel